MLAKTEMKEFVKDGCSKPESIKCSPAKIGTDDESSTTESSTDNGNKTSVVDGDGGKKNNTKDGDVDDGGGDSGGNDDAAIIAIVVVFLILLIILIVVFFITWYLKRNKGVYQTHEGSAENIHGDTDNLTLVTKPCDQEAEGDESKEYYL